MPWSVVLMTSVFAASPDRSRASITRPTPPVQNSRAGMESGHILGGSAECRELEPEAACSADRLTQSVLDIRGVSSKKPMSRKNGWCMAPVQKLHRYGRPWRTLLFGLDNFVITDDLRPCLPRAAVRLARTDILSPAVCEQYACCSRSTRNRDAPGRTCHCGAGTGRSTMPHGLVNR